MSVRSFQVPATPGHHRLAAQATVGADLARDARHLAGEGAQLIHHGIQRLLEQQDLAAHVDRDLARQIARGDGGRHLGDVAHLAREVAGHGIDVVGEILPRARDARHLRLAAQLSLGAHLARDARHLAGEGVQLVHHGIDGVLQLEDFALDVDGDFSRQVAACHRGGDLGDVAHLTGQVRSHGIDVLGEILPRTGDARHVRLAAELAFGAHFARNPGHFRCEPVELIDHGIERFFELQNFAAHVDGDLAR